MNLKISDNYKSNINNFLVFVCILFGSQFIVQYQAVTWPKLYLIILFFCMIFLLLFSNLMDKKKIAKNALVLISVIGITNATILPVFYDLDESFHYYNTLQLADGNLRIQVDEAEFMNISNDFSSISTLPKKNEVINFNTNLYSKEFRQLKNSKTDYNKNKITQGNFINPAYYPAAIGVAIGRLISNRLIVSYYLGRIFNILFYALLVFWGITMSRKYKIQLFVISTVPYALWITAGYNYDALYYGLIIIILSLFTNMLDNQHHPITRKQLVSYATASSCLVFCKAPVILLIFLPLFLNKNCYKDKMNKFWFKLYTVLGLLFSILWLMQSKIISIFSSVNILNISNGEESSRLFYFLSHPGYTVALILRSIIDIFVTIRNSIASPLPFNHPSEFMQIINCLSFLILVTFVSQKVSIKITKKVKFVIISLFIIISMGIIYAISGDVRVFKVGDLHVAGVQGRYHIYMLAFIPLLLGNSSFFLTYFSSRHIKEYDINSIIFKTIYFITFMNTCVAMYSYL